MDYSIIVKTEEEILIKIVSNLNIYRVGLINPNLHINKTDEELFELAKQQLGLQ